MTIVNVPNFYSYGEFRLCRAIYDKMRLSSNDIYVSFPSYSQDYIFANRLSAFLRSSKSHIVILDARKLDYASIIPSIIDAIDADSGNYSMEYFVNLLCDLFNKNDKIIVIMLYADEINAKLKTFLQNLSMIIYDKFPTKKMQSLFRFVYCGASNNYVDFKYFGMRPLDYVANYYLEDIDYHNLQVFHKINININLLKNSILGSFRLLRLVLPLSAEHIDSYHDIVLNHLDNKNDIDNFLEDYSYINTKSINPPKVFDGIKRLFISEK